MNYKYYALSYYCQSDSVLCIDLVNDSVLCIDLVNDSVLCIDLVNDSVLFIALINAYFMSFIWLACFGIDVIVSVYYSLLWHATTLVSFIYTWSLLPTKLYWLLNNDWSISNKGIDIETKIKQNTQQSKCTNKNGWMNEWMYEWMNERTNERTNEWMNIQMNIWMN